MRNLGASVYYYPLGARGFFVTAGLGVSTYRAKTSPVMMGTGWGLMLGVGYDMDVGRHVSLAPAASCMYGQVGEVKVADGSGTFATGWKQNVIHLGLALMFHR